MNKIVIKYIIFVVAVLILLFFLLRERSPFGKANSTFAVELNSEITRIEFSQGDKKLLLEKTDGNWMVNKKYKARKNAILFILRTLKEIKIKSPVSTEIYNNEIIMEGINPVRVKIFEKKRMKKGFYVYKTGSNVYGNIMKMRENSKPFIVFVPGYDGNIGAHFTLDELFWQPYMVFNLLPSQIASVELENYSDSSASFKISHKNTVFSMSAFRKNLTGWDTMKVKRYLSYFVSVPFETWVFDLTENEKKMIESQPPLYRITVNKTQGGKTVLTIWEKMNLVNGEAIKDTDRVWGRTDSKDNIFIMRYFDVDPVLKKKSYFFTE